MEAAGVADTAATTRATDAVADGSTASATIVTRADICGTIASSSVMDGPLSQGQKGRGAGEGRGRGRGGRGGGAANMRNGDNESESRDNRYPCQFFYVSTQALAAPEKDEGFEEPVAVGKFTFHSLDDWVIDSGATYSMTPRADLLIELESSPVKHVTSALGQRAEVKGMGKAMFKGADGKMVGLMNVLWVLNLAANLMSMRRLQMAAMDTSSKGAKTDTARLGERILWDLHEDRDVYDEIWQIPVVPMPKERQVAPRVKLQEKFKCKALGDINFYLGLHIERDVEKRCMRVHQRKYLEALAANFGQSEGHVDTPFPSGFKCVKGPEEESVGEEERRRFHSLVGSLMFAGVNIRPDVAFATGQLARVVQCPNEEQVRAGMRVAKYLGQTPTVALQYSAA
ncbi:unnamed protein product [Closterium sp. NIES-53]